MKTPSAKWIRRNSTRIYYWVWRPEGFPWRKGWSSDKTFRTKRAAFRFAIGHHCPVVERVVNTPKGRFMIRSWEVREPKKGMGA